MQAQQEGDDGAGRQVTNSSVPRRPRGEPQPQQRAYTSTGQYCEFVSRISSTRHFTTTISAGTPVSPPSSRALDLLSKGPDVDARALEAVHEAVGRGLESGASWEGGEG